LYARSLRKCNLLDDILLHMN